MGAFLSPKGTVPRASSLIGIQRGALATCDGSSIIAWRSGAIHSDDGRFMAVEVFEPTGVPPYLLALRQVPYSIGTVINMGVTATAGVGGAGLASNHTYMYAVTALDGIGGESLPEYAPGVSGSGAYKIAWQGIPNAFAYNIYREDITLGTGFQLLASPAGAQPCPTGSTGLLPVPQMSQQIPSTSCGGPSLAGFSYIDDGSAVIATGSTGSPVSLPTTDTNQQTALLRIFPPNSTDPSSYDVSNVVALFPPPIQKLGVPGVIGNQQIPAGQQVAGNAPVQIVGFPGGLLPITASISTFNAPSNPTQITLLGLVPAQLQIHDTVRLIGPGTNNFAIYSVVNFGGNSMTLMRQSGNVAAPQVVQFDLVTVNTVTAYNAPTQSKQPIMSVANPTGYNGTWVVRQGGTGTVFIVNVPGANGLGDSGGGSFGMATPATTHALAQSPTTRAAATTLGVGVQIAGAISPGLSQIVCLATGIGIQPTASGTNIVFGFLSFSFPNFPNGLRAGDTCTIDFDTQGYNGVYTILHWDPYPQSNNPQQNFTMTCRPNAGTNPPTNAPAPGSGTAFFNIFQVTTLQRVNIPSSISTINISGVSGGTGCSQYNGTWGLRVGGTGLANNSSPNTSIFIFTIPSTNSIQANKYPKCGGGFLATVTGSVSGPSVIAPPVNVQEYPSINSGIVGLLSPVPQMIQFTNRMIMALGNGYAPQYYADDTGTPINPAQTIDLTKYTITITSGGAPGGVLMSAQLTNPPPLPPATGLPSDYVLVTAGSSFILSGAQPASINGVGQILYAAQNNQIGNPNTPTQSPNYFPANQYTLNFIAWIFNPANTSGTPVPPSNPSPTITSLSPTFGLAGTSVTINGAHFGSAQTLSSTVTFNGVTATATAWTDTQIIATVPPTATTGNVVVTVLGNVSNGVPFTVSTTAPAVPNISSLSPTSGQAGTAVTISGSNFGGTGTVTFNGITAPITSWTSTSVVVTVPTGATTGPVILTSGGNASNPVTFTVTTTPPPTGPSINLADISGGVLVPAPNPQAGQNAISLRLQQPWSPSITVAVGDTLTVSGTGTYDGTFTVAGLSPTPDPYGITLLAGSNAATAIVLNQGLVTFAAGARAEATPGIAEAPSEKAAQPRTVGSGTITITAAPLYNNFTTSLPTWQPGIAVNVGDLYIPAHQPATGGCASDSGGNAGGVYVRCTQAGITVKEPLWPSPCLTKPTPGLFPIRDITEPYPAGVTFPTGNLTAVSGTATSSSGAPIWEEVGWLNSLNPAPPAAAHCAVYSACLFVFNTYPFQTGSSTQGWGIDGPTALRQSDVNNPFSWNPANATFIDKDDGSEGMGLGTWTIAAVGIAPIGSLFAFKNYSSYQITGLFGAGINIARIRTERGTTAPRTIRFIPAMGVARLTHLGVSVTDGVSDQLISDPIRPYLFVTNDRIVGDINPIDPSWLPFSYADLTANPPMYVMLVPHIVPGQLPGQSLGAMTRALAFDIVKPGWYPIDFPFSLSVISQAQLTPSTSVTLIGGWNDGLIQRWQYGDEVWLTPGGLDSTGAFVSPQQVAWGYRTPVTASKDPDQRIYVHELVIKGINSHQLGTITVTPYFDGVAYPPRQAALVQSHDGDFMAIASIRMTGQRFYADVAGTGGVEIDADNFHIVPKPIGGRMVFA